MKITDIECTHIDDQNYQYIDCYFDDSEQGKSVAVVDRDNGKVFFLDNTLRSDEDVKETIDCILVELQVSKYAPNHVELVKDFVVRHGMSEGAFIPKGDDMDWYYYSIMRYQLLSPREKFSLISREVSNSYRALIAQGNEVNFIKVFCPEIDDPYETEDAIEEMVELDIVDNLPLITWADTYGHSQDVHLIEIEEDYIYVYNPDTTACELIRFSQLYSLLDEILVLEHFQKYKS